MTWENLTWISVDQHTCPECGSRLRVFGRSKFQGIVTRLVQCAHNTTHAFQQYSDPWRKGR